MITYIEHDIPNNARFSVVCYKKDNIIYAKLKPLDDRTIKSLEQLYKNLSSDVECYPTISCRVKDGSFIGINRKTLMMDDLLLGRYLEGIPALRFHISDKKVPHITLKKTLRITLDGFLVDYIRLKPIENLKLKINTQYNVQQVSEFTTNLEIISGNDVFPDITIPDMPEPYCPDLSPPRTLSYQLPTSYKM